MPRPRTPQSPTPSLGTRLLDELRRSGADGATMADAAGHLSSGAFATLYRSAIERLEAQVAQGDSHAPMRKREVDLLCRCLLSCRTLDDAILCAADFCAMLHPRAGALSLSTEDGVALFRMDSMRRRHSPAACLVDVTGLLFYLRLFAWLIGEPFRPTRTFLGHPNREDAIPFLSLFEGPVDVGQPTYGFAFDAALLARPVRRRPAELEAFLVDFPFRLASSEPASAVSLTQQVRSFIDAALARQVPLPTQRELSIALSISEATLRRRLHAEGSGYRALREHCLLEAAQHYLRSTDWSIERVAGHLGFSNAAAMRRAMVRLTGYPPSHYRHAH
ncbi:AraC family transcriptional regulator [Metapseudomonas boanensis]|uniref:AraC family transcriptional regulator ligand-binding domain-containing protein n=1 Tax=Metapseudomonas boanensis TaxID=2822138 RepID=A0ABS5XEG1_9GAMM|nr:AraC family transcriptional regulator [Pseudomonas boanensis]MBT8766074.1 AraC family transcriptional regulator ligand-binding domain-containing protein [Pseudomonas boanensis]